MKLLFDQNLSLRLPKNLEDLFSESTHVRSVGLESADDRAVWEFAMSNGFVIATKDSDFFGRAVLESGSKVIWVAAGNCSTDQIESAFRDQHQSIKKAFDDEQTSIFVLL